MLKEIPLPFTVLGRTGISTYSILLMVAFLAASYLIPRELKRRGLIPEVADTAIFIAVIAGIVGSKLLFVFEIWNEIWIVDSGFGDTLYHVLFKFRGMGDKFPGRATGMWEALFSGGGLVFYGGFLAAFGSIVVYLKHKKFDVWTYGDAFIPSLALGYGIGRQGCLVSGDGCYGFAASADIPLLTMVYGPGSVLPSHGVNVWNTPVMETAAAVALFAFMMLWMRHQNFRPGMLVATFMAYNGLARFTVEFIRLNDALIPILERPMITLASGNTVPLSYRAAIATQKGAAYYFENWSWYGFTQGQVIAAALFLAGMAWILIGKLYRIEPVKGKKKKK